MTLALHASLERFWFILLASIMKLRCKNVWLQQACIKADSQFVPKPHINGSGKQFYILFVRGSADFTQLPRQSTESPPMIKLPQAEGKMVIIGSPLFLPLSVFSQVKGLLFSDQLNSDPLVTTWIDWPACYPSLILWAERDRSKVTQLVFMTTSEPKLKVSWLN